MGIGFVGNVVLASSFRGSVFRQQAEASARFAHHVRVSSPLPLGRARTRTWTDASAGGDGTVPPQRELTAMAKELRSLLRKCPLYFVGCMGCGKSAVAKYVAYELGYRFLDTDELIELAARQPVSQIFAESGEVAFRDLESAVLGQVQSFTGTCVATGGGVVLRPQNWGIMRSGIVVWLNAPPEVLAKRLEGDSSRPLLAGYDSAEEKVAPLAQILEARRGKYAQADVTVYITADQPVDDIGQEVIRRTANYIKENPPRFMKEQGLVPDDTPQSPSSAGA